MRKIALLILFLTIFLEAHIPPVWKFGYFHKENMEFKVAMDFKINDYLSFNMLSFNFMYDKNYRVPRVSSNLIYAAIPFTFVSIMGGSDYRDNPWLTSIAMIVLLPAFTSFELKFNFVDNLSVKASNSVDYFLFNKPSKIVSKGSIGFEYQFPENYTASVELFIPWNKGYSKNREPFLGFSLSHRL